MSTPNDEIVCKELVELVTPYLEDVLPTNERAAIERHLAECNAGPTNADQMRQPTVASAMCRTSRSRPGRGTRSWPSSAPGKQNAAKW